MTCGVGIVENGSVFLGYDSMASTNWVSHNSQSKRPIQKGEMVFLIAGSPRIAQLIEFTLSLPKHPDDYSVEGYMVTFVVDALRQCFLDGGHVKKENEEEAFDSHLLIGYRGHLFTIGSDFQVLETRDGYAAVGSGQEVALGALFATAGRSPSHRLLHALEAASYHTPFVRGPYHFLEVKNEPGSENPCEVVVLDRGLGAEHRH